MHLDLSHTIALLASGIKILKKPHFVVLEKQRRALLALALLVPVAALIVMSGASATAGTAKITFICKTQHCILTTVLFDIYYGCANRRNILPINAMASANKSCQRKKGDSQNILAN